MPGRKHLRTARWLFPLYMVVIALPPLPLFARAGHAQLDTPAGRTFGSVRAGSATGQ
ncbi:MAG: hypothetical protein IPK54_07965 [Dokdonella sp.]|uniref:hypothetical protein n=1 Tax=Dokdonella sp. TaxID=2291710 RepID=UPI0025BA39A6|nr:hypothetical protein [Dokdonella sp.]MBK8123475.1 hypothetical protein [Dokdonella sp.]